jgi:hypothetical protein
MSTLPPRKEDRLAVDRQGGGFSWNTHALLTRAALSPATVHELQEPVTLAPLSDFLTASGNDFQVLVRWHGDLLGARGGRSEPRHEISAPSSDRDFLELLRLNPNFVFAYVRLPQPDEVPSDIEHNPSRQGPGNRNDASAADSLYIETPLGGELSPWDILFTFSDEPDWGMDQDLYVLDGRPYGEAPFGIRTGPSSQGPFHMAFFHENPLLYLLLPALRRSFVEERCRLSFALADLAFRAQFPYWGWRFAAWAVHYLQDITQPYHARAFPPSLLSVVRRFLTSGTASGFGGLLRDTLKAHHFLFEGLVHFLLNEAVKRGTFRELTEALAGTEDLGGQPLDKILKLSSRQAAILAGKADRSLRRLFGDLSLGQVEHLLGGEAASPIAAEFHGTIRTHPEALRQFMACACPCLKDAGIVTRYALARIRGGASPVL